MIKSLEKRKKFFKLLNFFYSEIKNNSLLETNFQNFIIAASGCLFNLKKKNFQFILKRSKFSNFKKLLIFFPFKKIIHFSNSGLNSKVFFFKLLFKGYLLLDFNALKIRIKRRKILFSKDQKLFLFKYLLNKKKLNKLINQKYPSIYMENVPSNLTHVITGSVKPQSIFLLNKIKNSNTKSILIHHGLNSGFIDEPQVGYQDNSYVDHVIYFGNLIKKINFKKKRPLFSKYSKKNIKTHYCSNNLKFKKYKIKNQNSIDQSRFLFIGTEFNNANFYLPYGRILENEHYEIAKFYKKLFNNIYYAPHPDCINNKIKNIFKKKIEQNWENNLINYDFLIFNHWSTAIVKAIFSNIPIIFFDHNIRKFSDEGLNFIKQRTVYINKKKMSKKKILMEIKKLKKKNYEKLLSRYFPNNLSNIETEVLKIIQSNN